MLVQKRLVSLPLALALLLPAALLLVPGLAAAEEGPVTWVIMDTLKPGKAQQWSGLVTENYGPVLDQMQADGQILSWGLAQRSNVSGAEPTHAGWVTYPSWTAMAAVEAAFKAHFADASPEDMMAIGEGFNEAVEPHSSIIRHLRGVVFEVSGGAPGYLVTADWNPRPGKASTARQLYEGVRTGVFAGLLEDGSINGYGLYEQAMHDGGSHFVSWYGFETLAALDAVDAAFAAWEAERGDEGQAALAEVMDLASHRDVLWQVMHVGGTGGDDGDAGDDGDDGGE